jgi:pimeloyl-ACP methyl ester carboxylesterase
MLVGCDVTGNGVGDDPVDDPDAGDTAEPTGVEYHDDLAAHPGCTSAGLGYTAAAIPGYSCAAKQYPFPDGASEDTSKPIVLLIHGNSDSPAAWERFPADEGIDQLAERLSASGFRTIAVDLRIDRVSEMDPVGDNESENAAHNIDHGWSVPIVQHLIESVVDANAGRRVSVVSFSLGVTVTRDALRRLQRERGADVWSQIEDLVYLAGANHGVSSCALCASNPTMRGVVTCEMGCRDNFSPTQFMSALNGAGGEHETPCSDGATAYGESDACGGNVVDHTTIVMRDLPDGTYQDLFVSEESARLAGADNRRIELTDVDPSGYFFDGLFRNHYGACRSEAALSVIATKLAD